MKLYIPDQLEKTQALGRTTHLGIGAHQDDLEFMAVHGILECHGKEGAWFGGIICTSGAGSARSGPYAECTDEEMVKIRQEEQNEAARIGQYAFMAQLGHSSGQIKNEEGREKLARDLADFLAETQPAVLYTHNPIDKHPSHLAVLKSVLRAIHLLPAEKRPRQLLGCEVWRGLDWLPDQLKVILDVGGNHALVRSLNAVFRSQIEGGKRYDEAVIGRRVANATFLDAHSVDNLREVTYAVDLTSLMDPEGPGLKAFASGLLEAFRREALDLLD